MREATTEAQLRALYRAAVVLRERIRHGDSVMDACRDLDAALLPFEQAEQARILWADDMRREHT